MPTWIIHHLQIFPILLLIFAAIKFDPLIDFLSYEKTSLILACLSLSGLILSFGKAHAIRVKVLIFLLVAISLIVLNALVFYPSVGVLTIIFTAFIAINIRKFNETTRKDSLASKGHIMMSYLLFLVPLLAISPGQFENNGLHYFAIALAGISVLWLSVEHIKLLGKLRTVVVVLPILAFCLYVFKWLLALELMTFVLFLLSTAAAGYLFVRRQTLKSIESSYTKMFTRPELIVVGYFVLAALIGSFFLQMPISQADSVLAKHSLLDSLFTSMSAICVTGLIVLDTPVEFSFFGQAIILSLIQLGGLGITSLSAWILLVLSSGRLNLSHEDALHGMSGHMLKLDIKAFVKRIFMYFLTMELIGTVALFPAFLTSDENWYTALWRALFTSISAFCNAGFALQSDSLVAYQDQSFVLLIVSVLIIAGGFAPLLMLDLPKRFRLNRFGLQEKVVFSMTVCLLALGFFYFLFVEWDYSLNKLTFFDRMTNAWFQSVTTRTAGFNSVDLTEARSVTHLFFMILMFIGGNPGSTAGGVKTVAIAVLFIAGLNALRESDEATAFYKRIPYKTVFRALLVVILGLLVHFVAFFFLSVTQDIDSISLLFETFSALGTVGLSTGATSKLDEIGKVVIIFCMLVGRVGPLTFILLLMKQHSRRIWKVPQEDVSIT